MGTITFRVKALVGSLAREAHTVLPSAASPVLPLPPARSAPATMASLLLFQRAYLRAFAHAVPPPGLLTSFLTSFSTQNTFFERPPHSLCSAVPSTPLPLLLFIALISLSLSWNADPVAPLCLQCSAGSRNPGNVCEERQESKGGEMGRGDRVQATPDTEGHNVKSREMIALV